MGGPAREVTSEADVGLRGLRRSTWSQGLPSRLRGDTFVYTRVHICKYLCCGDGTLIYHCKLILGLRRFIPDFPTPLVFSIPLNRDIGAQTRDFD